MMIWQLRKRLVALSKMVMVATFLSITLMAAGLSLDSLDFFTEKIEVSSVTAVTESDHIRPVMAAIGHNPTIESSPLFESMSPAEALTNGKPSLFFFQPYELCQTRYCRQPATIADELQAHYQDEVNFVLVTAYAIPADNDMETQPPLLYDNWDLYPVPPISDWLPQPSITEFGLGLAGPVAVLVNGDGHLIYQGNEFVTIDELEPELQVLLEDQVDVVVAEIE
jgi:hypothetical protein